MAWVRRLIGKLKGRRGGVGRGADCRDEKGKGLQGVVRLGEGMYGVCGGGYWNVGMEIWNRGWDRDK